MDKYHLKFGAVWDNAPALGIHKGRITLYNQELQPVFDEVLGKIVENCSTMIKKSRTEVM
jgi:hypothetical protein